MKIVENRSAASAFRRVSIAGLVALACVGTGKAAPGAGGRAPAAAVDVQVQRATDFIGTDVISADGRKVADIVDFVFNTARPPRLAYVIAMTGGILDLGGPTRAIPADALTLQGDKATIDLTRAEYLAIPKLPKNREAFLANPQNLAPIAEAFHVSPAAVAPGASPATLVTFSELSHRDAYARDGERLGFIDDLWISLNQDRAPYVEIVPMFRPFEPPSNARYAIPLSRLEANGTYGRYTFALSANALENASPVTETPGVAVVQGDQNVLNGSVVEPETILRVTLPASQASAGAMSAARPGAPTGRPSSGGSATAVAQAAAQRVRRALDNDGSLRRADVRVTAQNGHVMLNGGVASSKLRGRIEEAAEEAANGVDVENNLNVDPR